MFLKSRILKSYNLRPDFIHFIERINYPSDHDLFDRPLPLVTHKEIANKVQMLLLQGAR